MALGSHDLPDEIICKIFSFSNPIDIIRARLVSKRIRDISYDHEVWRSLYTNARLPRPPGPFPYQSTQALEHILVRSTRIAESWTTRPMEVISASETRLGLLQRASPKLLCGRWMISCEKNSELVLHDPINTPLRKVIWEAEEGATISFWESCSITSAEGESIYVVVFGRPAFGFTSESLLLEFRVNGNTLEFCSSLDIPTGTFRSITGIYGENGPFLNLQGLRLIFDTRTRIFYGYPQFSTQLDGIEAPRSNPHRVVLTSTYVIAFHYSVVGGLPNSVLIQAFALPFHPPRLSPDGVCHLQLTHECIGIPEHMSLMTLIRDSTVDSTTGSTNLRFMCRKSEARRLSFNCIDFALPKPRENAVLPISFLIHEIVAITGPFSPSDDRFAVQLYTDASWDGHVRGYIRFRDIVDQEYRYFTTKFSIDATEEKCRAVVGEPSMQDKDNHITAPTLPAFFDGIRGRICYGTGPMNGVHGYSMVHIAEIR